MLVKHIFNLLKIVLNGLRLQKYLDETGQTANSYIKGLIKRDIDEKGIEL